MSALYYTLRFICEFYFATMPIVVFAFLICLIVAIKRAVAGEEVRRYWAFVLWAGIAMMLMMSPIAYMFYFG